MDRINEAKSGESSIFCNPNAGAIWSICFPSSAAVVLLLFFGCFAPQGGTRAFDLPRQRAGQGHEGALRRRAQRREKEKLKKLWSS
ncbi:MAG: hypothetical protein ACLRSW_13340 [Christensenellaceae bacterium]